jgi:hypothetical protein
MTSTDPKASLSQDGISLDPLNTDTGSDMKLVLVENTRPGKRLQKAIENAHRHSGFTH